MVPAGGGQRHPLLADDRAGSTRADVRVLMEAPDGDSLLVSTYDAEDGTIAVLPLDDGEVHEVVDHAAHGVWSPDGEHIYYAARADPDDDHSWRLRSARLDGTDAEDETDVADLDIGYLYGTVDIAVAPCADR